MDELKKISALAVTAAVGSTESHGASNPNSIDELVARLKSSHESASAEACLSAREYGAGAVRKVAALMADADAEVVRRGKRALYNIVRHAGRPGAGKEAAAVEKELIALLKNQPVLVRRQMLWMLSEIGSDRAVAPMAALLADPELREDARCALTRLPAGSVTTALTRAFAKAPEDFKPALAESLRALGQPVSGYPSRKLVPTKRTEVVALKPKTN